MSAMKYEGGSMCWYYEQAVQFLRDVRSELRKVTFPSRKETVASTIVVIDSGVYSVYIFRDCGFWFVDRAQ